MPRTLFLFAFASLFAACAAPTSADDGAGAESASAFTFVKPPPLPPGMFGPTVDVTSTSVRLRYEQSSPDQHTQVVLFVGEQVVDPNDALRAQSIWWSAPDVDYTFDGLTPCVPYTWAVLDATDHLLWSATVHTSTPKVTSITATGIEQSGGLATVRITFTTDQEMPTDYFAEVDPLAERSQPSWYPLGDRSIPTIVNGQRSYGVSGTVASYPWTTYRYVLRTMRCGDLASGQLTMW